MWRRPCPVAALVVGRGGGQMIHVATRRAQREQVQTAVVANFVQATGMVEASQG